MERVERFEDLVAWQKARAWAKDIYCATANREFSRDHGLQDQMRRAAVSVMANIAEGFERASGAEFHQFVSVAKASCAEARSHLYVAMDAAYIDQPTFDRLMKQGEEIAREI